MALNEVLFVVQVPDTRWDELTFAPEISKRARMRPARSMQELSEGDRLRRQCYLVSYCSSMSVLSLCQLLFRCIHQLRGLLLHTYVPIFI